MHRLRRLASLGGLPALLAVAIGCCALAIAPAFAQAAGVNVTQAFDTITDLLIGTLGTLLVYVIQDAAKKLTGQAVSSNALDTVKALFEHGAHDLVNTHLLKDGEITVNTKSELGNLLLQRATAAVPTVLAQSNLTPDTLAALAQGAVAKALNNMPSAPPFAPAAPSVKT
jgi:hypothetical protein